MNKYHISFIKSIISGGLIACAMFAGAPASATYPDGYYDSLEGKCGRELMNAIKSICAKHTALSYSGGTWEAFHDTDVKTIDGVDYWWDMYSDDLVKVGSGKPDNNVINVEHSIPKSWWGGGSNNAYKDIVHLNPSNSDANSRKSNYPYAELASVSWNNGVTFIGSPKSGMGGGSSKCYEPHDMYKGDFARICFYMFTVYDDISWTSNTDWMYDKSTDLILKPWAQTMLLRWGENDPVSEKELNRNDAVYKHQKNRNPFIDFPDLAEHIWGSKKNIPFSLSGAVPDPDPDPVDPDPVEPGQQLVYNWLPQTNTALDPEWTIEDVTLPSATKSIWSWKAYSGAHYLNASAHINDVPYVAESYIWSPIVDFSNVKSATVSFDHAAKFQTTCKDYCKLVYKDADTDNITEVSISTWPAAGSWTFVNTGDIALPETNAKKVQIGFKYKSDTSGADTWEMRNVSLKLERDTSGISDTLDDSGYDDSDLVGVYGNNIYVPEGAAIFDLNGRRVDGFNLQPGIYIVVKSTFAKNIKIAIQ